MDPLDPTNPDTQDEVDEAPKGQVDTSPTYNPVGDVLLTPETPPEPA